MQYLLRHFLLFIFVGFIQCSYASVTDPDSLTFVNKSWEAERLKKGVVWKKAHFDNLFDSRQIINIIEIDLKKQLKNFKITGDSTLLIPTSRFASQHNALAAINGGFFNMKDGGSVDLLKVDGTIINKPSRASTNANAALVFSKRTLKIIEATKVEENLSPNIMVSGPHLLSEGISLTLNSTPFVDNRHPRTAIAVTSDRKLLLITADGRNRDAQGLNLHELTKVMKWLGARNAMNLDGGGSTTMYIQKHGVVNYPSDNKQLDHQGERSVANILYIK